MHSLHYGGNIYSQITICTNGYIDFGNTSTCSAEPKMLSMGLANRTAVFWNDLVADYNVTASIANCSLSGPGTYGPAVSYKVGTSNDGLVDALVHGSSAPGAAYFKSVAWITVSWFGVRLYSTPSSTPCSGRVHAQLVVALSSLSSTFIVLQYAATQPDSTDISVRTGAASMTDRLEFWPSLDSSGLSISQHLGGKGNAGAPGRWVFRVDGQYVQYGLPSPYFVPAEAYQGSSGTPYVQQLSTQ